MVVIQTERSPSRSHALNQSRTVTCFLQSSWCNDIVPILISHHLRNMSGINRKNIDRSNDNFYSNRKQFHVFRIAKFVTVHCSLWAKCTQLWPLNLILLTVEGAINPYLFEVEVPIVDQEQCKSYYAPDLITDDMMCAGLTEGGKDACQVSIDEINLGGYQKYKW